MPGYSGAGADFKKPFTVDQIPGLKQAADATAGRVYSMSYDDGTQGQFIYKDDQLVPFNGKDIVYKDEQYYDQDSGSYGTHKVAYSTGQSVIDQAMADPNKWVASNINWGGLGRGGDFSALDDQIRFLKDNKYDLSTLPNQGGVNQYNLTKQILAQGTTGKWSGEGYGGPVENAKVMAGMLANTGIKDIKDFGKFKGVVSRQLTNVQLKDPEDPSKGYVYPEVAGEEFTGRMLDVPKDVEIKDVQIGYTPEDSYILKQAEIPVYGETFGNKVTKQSFVDAQNYNRAHGNIFSGTYAGHGHTGFGVQFAADGTPYFYTRFGGDTSSMADIAPVLSFLSVIPSPLQPFAAAANALISLDNGNTLGALASLAGIPGVSEAAGAAGLASVATAVKTANQVVNLVNAIETGNVMALATSAAGMLGANTGSIQIGDTGLTVSDAMKAVNLVKAFESGNPLGMFNAAVSFGTAPNIQKALNSPTTTLDADGQRVADFVGPTFVADLVDPNSENFLGGAEESLGTVLAEAPDNIGSFDSVFAGLKDFGSKYFGGPSQDFFTSQAPAGDGDLVGPTYTPESIGSVGNLMSGPSTDVAGGSNLVDLAAIERERGQVTLGDIQGKQIDLTNVASGSTLPEVVVGGPSKEDVDNILKAEDEEVQADLEKAITDAENEVDPAEAQRQEAARVEAARVDAERIEAERVEAERLEAERVEAERVRQEEAEAEILRQEEIRRQAEEARLEAQREAARQLEIAEAARLAREAEDQAEAERLAQEAEDEASRQAAIVAEAQAEAERLRLEAAEAARIESERLEAQRLEAERLAAEKEAQDVEDARLEAERLRQETVGDQVDDGVSTDTSGADGLAGAADENTLIGGDGAANNGVTSEDDWLGGTGNDSLDGGVSTDTSGSNDGLLDLSSEEVGQGEVDAINDDALLDLSSAEVGQDEQDAINNDALLGLSSAEVGEEEQKAIDEADGTDDDGNCKPGFHRDSLGLCVSDEDEPEPEECKIGEVRDLTTGKCVPATPIGVSTPVTIPVTTPVTQPVRRAVTTGALPGIFSTSERPIVTAPSINDDPVMRGALPDMPQETKFQGPLDQFLKLAMESSTPKPQQPQQQQAGNMNDRLTYPQGGSDYFTYGQQSDIDNNLYSQFGQAPTDQPMDGALQFAQGGLAVPLMAAGGTRYGQYAGGGLNVVEHSGKHRVDFRKGDAVTGPGDGQSDDIPAMLADGEFVFPADVVAALGNGSTKAGSDKLYDMMHSIRAYHRSAKPKDLPPPAKKSPLDYLKGKKSTKARS